MSGNAKNSGRFLLILFLIALYCFGCSPKVYKNRIKEHMDIVDMNLDPNDHHAHHQLGLRYVKKARGYTSSNFRKAAFQEAIHFFEEAIRIKPDFLEPYCALGSIYSVKEIRNGFGAIRRTIICSKLAEKHGNFDLVAHSRGLLRSHFNFYRNYRPADFANIQIPGSSQPSYPVRPPESQPPPKAIESAYSGTGFLFSAKDYVITNWHVVRGTNNIKVKFLNGEEIKAEVALKDPQNDIAFLKLEQSPQLPASDLKIADSSKVRMGDKVFTIGYPAHWLMGDNPKYTEGVVNATSGLQDDPTVFQVSVEIQPGNSGGPLFNETGEVIGITSSSLDPKAAVEAFGTLPQNVNYAIKSTYISALLPMLPQTLIASRGIMVVPTEPENTLANFIEKAKKNIVLIEAKE
jgi:S1-C subfamily serine protease